jgi:hypothetical protein
MKPIGNSKLVRPALRTWRPVAVAAGIVWALCFARPADAQNGLIGPDTIACSSDNGQRQYCKGDTRRGVRLIPQTRGIGCRPATWGYDTRGVWVDRGCQAEFDISGGADHGRDHESSTVKTIAAGTGILVRNSETIDVRKSDGRVFSGVVDQDVLDENGAVTIPRGSYAKLIVKDAANQYLALDLELVEVDGLRYMVTTNGDRTEGEQRAGIEPNPRAGDLVDGGALIDSITRLFTRGKTVKIPAESFLTFRLEQPLKMEKANK